MSEPLGLRDRKKQRTRRAIEQAALELFESEGFDGATIEAIARAADISPRTFFHYFPSKEDVVLADYEERLARILEVLEQAPTNQAPWSALRSAFMVVGADYDAQRDELLRRFRIILVTPSVAARNLQLQATWEQAVTEAVADWLGVTATQDIRPGLLAGAALACMRASLRRWLLDEGRPRLPDHIQECFDVMEAGLGKVGRTP